MYPLDFEEFLWATGRNGLVEVISSHCRDKEPMGAAHRKAKDAFREYLVVGGMPQAVAKWVETSDLKKVDAVKRRVLSLYRADIRKHAGKYAMKTEAIFDEIPLYRHLYLPSITYHRIYKNAVVGKAECIYVGTCLSEMCQKTV